MKPRNHYEEVLTQSKLIPDEQLQKKKLLESNLDKQNEKPKLPLEHPEVKDDLNKSESEISSREQIGKFSKYPTIKQNPQPKMNIEHNPQAKTMNDVIHLIFSFDLKVWLKILNINHLDHILLNGQPTFRLQGKKCLQ